MRRIFLLCFLLVVILAFSQTPNYLSFALKECYSFPEPHPHLKQMKKVMEFLVKEGYIQRCETDSFGITQKRAFRLKGDYKAVEYYVRLKEKGKLLGIHRMIVVFDKENKVVLDPEIYRVAIRKVMEKEILLNERLLIYYRNMKDVLKKQRIYFNTYVGMYLTKEMAKIYGLVKRGMFKSDKALEMALKELAICFKPLFLALVFNPSCSDTISILDKLIYYGERLRSYNWNFDVLSDREIVELYEASYHLMPSITSFSQISNYVLENMGYENLKETLLTALNDISEAVGVPTETVKEIVEKTSKVLKCISNFLKAYENGYESEGSIIEAIRRSFETLPISSEETLGTLQKAREIFEVYMDTYKETGSESEACKKALTYAIYSVLVDYMKGILNEELPKDLLANKKKFLKYIEAFFNNIENFYDLGHLIYSYIKISSESRGKALISRFESMYLNMKVVESIFGKKIQPEIETLSDLYYSPSEGAFTPNLKDVISSNISYILPPPPPEPTPPPRPYVPDPPLESALVEILRYSEIPSEEVSKYSIEVKVELIEKGENMYEAVGEAEVIYRGYKQRIVAREVDYSQVMASRLVLKSLGYEIGKFVTEVYYFRRGGLK